MSEKKRTEISELGEFGLIDRLTSKFTIKQSSSLTGVGDDAAVLSYAIHYWDDCIPDSAE